MPQLTVDIDDKGDFVGQLPTELEAIIKRTEAAADGKGYGRGVQKAAEDAKKQIEETVKARVAEIEARQPLERERYEGIDSENKALKTRLDEMARTSERTLRSREEIHAEELNRRVETIKKRDGKISQLVRGQIRGLAVESGARDESLDELEIILGSMVGFDDDMEPFVKGPDGSPMQQHGKAVALGSYVKSYIDTHPHHRRSANGTRSDARNGASLRNGGGGATANITEARTRVEQGDRSTGAINDLFNASRAKRSA
jgi:hypothetical protein